MTAGNGKGTGWRPYTSLAVSVQRRSQVRSSGPQSMHVGTGGRGHQGRGSCEVWGEASIRVHDVFPRCIVGKEKKQREKQQKISACVNRTPFPPAVHLHAPLQRPFARPGEVRWPRDFALRAFEAANQRRQKRGWDRGVKRGAKVFWEQCSQAVQARRARPVESGDSSFGWVDLALSKCCESGHWSGALKEKTERFGSLYYQCGSKYGLGLQFVALGNKSQVQGQVDTVDVREICDVTPQPQSLLLQPALDTTTTAGSGNSLSRTGGANTHVITLPSMHEFYGPETSGVGSIVGYIP
ncbi:hypothetical protein V8F20_010076 [Naviculisporaceae sp. PSN 640]